MSDQQYYQSNDQDFNQVPNDDKAQGVQKKSSYAAKGSRYFQVDEGYDKRVYENDWKNWLIIIGVFIIYFGCNILYWWGMVAFGTAHPDAAQWYSIAMFLFSLVWIAGMLVSGYKANKKLFRWEFYLEKINDKEQEIRETNQREAQKREQERKIAEQARDKDGGKPTKLGDDPNAKYSYIAPPEEEQKEQLTMRDADSDDDHHSRLLEDH